MRKWLVLAACLTAFAANAGTFVKPEVTLDLPVGWVEVPAATLQQLQDEMRRQMPNAQVPKYDYAFQAAAGPPWLSYPYVLVKLTTTGRPAEPELETLPSIDLNDQIESQRKDWTPLMNETSLGKMRYDKAANVVWITSKSDVVNVGSVSGISGIIPTEQGFVELHAYAKSADFADRLPTFEKIITGARVAPLLKYQPRWSDQLGPAAGVVGRFNFKLAGFLLAIGTLVGIFVTIYRRKRT